MNDMREALKPCPFCGSEAELERGNDHHGEWFNLGCSRHYARVDPDSACPAGRIWYTENPENEEDAIEAWNTRGSIAQPEAVEADQIQRAMDMLGDVPGNTILERVKLIVSYYLALQCELEKVRAVPPLAPDARMRSALERCAEGWSSVLELDLLPERHRETAVSLRDAALDALRRADSHHASETKIRKALEKIAGSHWERIGHCQSDVDDVPDLTAEEAMREAREALSGAADALDASAEARLRSDLGIVLSALRMHEQATGETFDDEGGDIARIERDYNALSPAGGDEAKKSEGCVEGHAQCLTIDRQSSIGFGSCRSSVEAGIKPGPSDPTPAEQREAIARAKMVAQRYIDSVSDDLPPEVTPPTSDEVGEALCILALSTRAGG